MKFRPYAVLACCLTVVGLAGCRNDPTSTGSGVPAAIVTSRALTNQTAGTHFSVTAYAIDENAQRMEGVLAATSNGAAVAIDSVVYVPELLETRVFVKAVSKSAAGTTFTVSGHNLSKDVTVVIS